MIRNLTLYVALRCAHALLPYLPLSLAYLLADLAGLVAFAVVPSARRSICQNLSVVTGKSAGSRAVRRLARDAFANDAKNWVDTMRIRRVSDQEIRQAVEIEGWDRLESALAAGKGLILVTMHLGNYDLVGQVITARGHRLTIPVERMQPEALFHLLTQERRSKGIDVVPIKEAPRAMLRALRAGEIVALAGDRNVAGRTVDVEFFGRPTALPRGAVSLARRTGAPIVVGAGVRLPSRLFHGYVSEPIDIVKTTDAESDDLENAQRLARVMESFVARFPGQWLVFTRVWPRNAKETTLTMEHTEAAVR